MQASRCLRASARQHLAPFACRGIRDAGSLDRYKTIWKFFRRELHATDSLKKPAEHSQASFVRIWNASNAVQKRLHIRSLHNSCRLLRAKEPTSGESKQWSVSEDDSKAAKPLSGENVAKSNEQARYQNLENYSRFFRRLAMSLPPMQRPTRDDFLRVATSFWQRLRIRFKWFTIKSFRKFNADDISAFVTWFVMSQTVWVLLGT